MKEKNSLEEIKLYEDIKSELEKNIILEKKFVNAAKMKLR